ncbi:7-deoxyloganetic acid glucosyltransferase, partial [Thalictrum thalictroides]
MEMAMAEMDQKSVPHVLVFPFPLPGHVNPMLQLVELLCLSGLSNVTFLTTKHYHCQLFRFTDAQTRFSSFPGFQFEIISDGLPDDHPRSYAHIVEIFTGVRSVMEPSFGELLHSNYFQSVNRPPVTCIITDGLMSFPIVVAKQLGIKSMNFRPTGASFLWCCYNHLKMIEAGELPFE